MMIGGYTTYDSITKEEDATGFIPLVPQQQDHQAHILIEDEVGAADGRRTIQTRSVAAILVGILLVGASVLVSLSATDRSGGGLGGRVAWRSSSSSRTDNVVGVDKATATVSVSTALATVTLDDSCTTTSPDYPGAGPCCDGGEVQCSDVCDWLLKCDDGYVPELYDDAAVNFQETSTFQPYNCHCQGGDYGGCFCQQLRDIVYHSVKGEGVGDCDPCLPPPPPPTPSPTTLLSTQTCREDHTGRKYLDDGKRNTDTSKPFYSCFVVNSGSVTTSKYKIGDHCWTRSIQIHGINVGCYPFGYLEAEDRGITSWSGTSGIIKLSPQAFWAKTHTSKFFIIEFLSIKSF